MDHGLDFDRRLAITINNSRPVVLTDLTLALLAVSHQFERFVENEVPEEVRVGNQLFIKEVRTGSVVVELIAQALPVVPLLWSGGTLAEWVNYAKAVVDWLAGRANKPPRELAKDDLRQWNNLVAPIAHDSSSQMVMTVMEGATIVNHFHFNSLEANAAQNRIQREMERLDAADSHIQRKRVMTWFQAKFDRTSSTGNKAVIESITKAPLKVIFENDAVKAALQAGDARFSKPWQELAYVVDVRVQTVLGMPKLYTIVNYYADETFDPDE